MKLLLGSSAKALNARKKKKCYLGFDFSSTAAVWLFIVALLTSTFSHSNYSGIPMNDPINTIDSAF